MPDLPLDAYLDRIAWAGPVSASPDVLADLHRHHALAIPFENIDPFSGRPVSVEPGDLVEKILGRRRGGYCFEQNALFQHALHTIGFRTQALCARVLISEGHYGPRSHQITLVDFAGARWLADVGFGGNGLLEAIPFELECEFDQKLDQFRLRADPTHGYRLEHRLAAGWRTLYAFSLDPYLPADFGLLNYGICRSPASIFTQVPICVRTTATERRIIAGNQFKIRRQGHSPATTLESAVQLRETLASQFGITLPDDYPLPAPPAKPAGMREI